MTGGRLCAGSFEALFEQLTELVTALAECSVPADSSALVGVRAQIDRLTAVVTEAEIRFDQAELWRDAGSGSLRGWMADHCGLGRRAAPAALAAGAVCPADCSPSAVPADGVRRS